MMSTRSVHSRRSEQIQRCAIAFIRGECGVPVADQVGEPVSGVVKIRSEQVKASDQDPDQDRVRTGRSVRSCSA